MALKFKQNCIYLHCEDFKAEVDIHDFKCVSIQKALTGCLLGAAFVAFIEKMTECNCSDLSLLRNFLHLF